MTFPGSDAPPARGPALAAASSPLSAHARRLRRALPAALVVALALAGCGRREEAPPAPRPGVAMP
ncbi:efflux RND transporter periplasmic adaptor subunit, partial [Achromobacter sp. Marseille-Q0513]|nr:efflux RND transporter periplasmic adaptor subunit [Achromobacter sp. Marseille-Q0513]